MPYEIIIEKCNSPQIPVARSDRAGRISLMNRSIINNQLKG